MFVLLSFNVLYTLITALFYSENNFKTNLFRSLYIYMYMNTLTHILYSYIHVHNKYLLPPDKKLFIHIHTRLSPMDLWVNLAGVNVIVKLDSACIYLY